MTAPASPSSGRDRSAARTHAPAAASARGESSRSPSARAPVSAVTAIATSRLKGKSQPPGRRKKAAATATEAARAARIGARNRRDNAESAARWTRVIAAHRPRRAGSDGPAGRVDDRGQPGAERAVMEMEVPIEPFALGEAPRDHQLAPAVHVRLDPAVPGDGRERAEDDEWHRRRQDRPSAVCRLPPFDSRRIPPVQEKMATRNPFARAIASATSRLWFPAALATTRNLPRALMHRGGRALASVYYRMRPKYLRAARRNLAVILGAPEDSDPVRRAALDMVVSHFLAWVDFLHFATRSPEEAARLVEGVVGLLADRRGPARRARRAAPDGAPRQLGGRRSDARPRQPADPRRPRARHLPGRRARAAPPPRALRGRGDPRRPQLRADPVRPESARPERHRRDAGRPRLRQHRRRRAVLRPRRLLSPRARCAWRWRRVRPCCRRSSCVSPTGGIARSSRNPCAIETDGDRDAALRTNLLRYVALLERYVREYPDQWYCFYPFWDDPSRKVIDRPDSGRRRPGGRATTGGAGR